MKAPYPDLAGLREYYMSATWQEALPASMSDAWLRGAARDLRQIEMPDGDPGASSRAVLLLAVITGGRARFRNLRVKAIEDDDAWRLLSAYHFLVEREIVSRAVGLNVPGDERAFIDLVDAEMEQHASRGEHERQP